MSLTSPKPPEVFKPQRQQDDAATEAKREVPPVENGGATFCRPAPGYSLQSAWGTITGRNRATVYQNAEQAMAGDLPIWIERYADVLGCDPRPASVAVAIEDLLAERECQLKVIGRLRGSNAELQQLVTRPAHAREAVQKRSAAKGKLRGCIH